MKLSQRVLELIARRMNVPQLAVEMFKKANEISGIDKDTLPTELIPLNMVQLSRGLLNFTLLQSIRDWILPYWAVEQYSPLTSSFIPRSHLGLSMNLTHRNWTAVGSMECNIEPIVDPRGMVTPFRDGWSLDVWMKVDSMMHYPSAMKDVHQQLVENVPVVETRFDVSGIECTMTTYVVKTELVHSVTVRNARAANASCTLFAAIRPFNPEGVGIVTSIDFSESENCFIVNGTSRVYLDCQPSVVHCSTFERGDCMSALKNPNRKTDWVSAHCEVGLANAVAGFSLRLAPDEERTIRLTCPLQHDKLSSTIQHDIAEAIDSWKEAIGQGARIITPDSQLNALFTSSLATLLLLVDGDSITPGPFTYHQFWFRDAAYMLWALDKCGYFHVTSPIIASFSNKLTREGYFRSQQGEWDSNGQALWTAWQHVLLSNDDIFVREHVKELKDGARWIENKRLQGAAVAERPFDGLMPRGLSAEHLGLADYYFWDNFWSVAGLEAYAAMCERGGQTEDGKRARQLAAAYWQSIEAAITFAQKKFETEAITAGPLRGIDCGMIGSIVASYPLQLCAADDVRIRATLRILEERFSFKGMFFQDFIHSGMNVYLTIQIAHAWLYAGERAKFWEMFSTACSVASPTMTFPEAIHPATGGGCMGDGHHGWAAAEVVLALRDAFVFERRKPDQSFELVLFAGIPASWLVPGCSCSANDLPVQGGQLSLACMARANEIEIEIQFTPMKADGPRTFSLELPLITTMIVSAIGERIPFGVANGSSKVTLKAESCLLRVLR